MQNILFVLLTVVLTVTASVAEPGPESLLKVYGPGGPLGPMKECAEVFSAAEGVRVEVVAGPEGAWIGQAKQDADLVFGGAEYMLTDFTLKYPGLIDGSTRVNLYPRSAGILVRKGNPKKIGSLNDLAKPGIRIIDVNGTGQLGLWEDMAGSKGLIGGIQKNIALSVRTSAEAIDKWKSSPDFDAWITYESWHFRLKEITDLVTLPEKEKIYRKTPIAVTTITDNRELALKFVQFLQSKQAHEIFRKWGWK